MESSKKAVFLSMVALVGLVAFFHSRGWLRIIDRPLRAILNPLAARAYRVGRWGNEMSVPGQAGFSSSTAAVKIQLLEEENAELRRQLHFFANATYAHVTADVIGRNLQPIGTALCVNRGAKHGIAVGDPVVVGNGNLVGVIARTETETSMVRLLTDDQSNVAATLMNRDRSIGLIEGGYDISVRMIFIPQTEAIHVGDAVITSGLQPSIPRGLLVGDVAAVVKEAYQPFQYAIVTPAVPLQHIVIVSIITHGPL